MPKEKAESACEWAEKFIATAEAYRAKARNAQG